MAWFNKSHPLFGIVHFPGSLPCRAEDFDFLVAHGIDVLPAKTVEDEAWALQLRHRAWGNARLSCANKPPAMPDELLALDPRLTDDERSAWRHAQSQVLLHMDEPDGHILHDRKQFLRFAHAVGGSDAVGVVDFVAQALWSRESLEEELAHDADLDVQQIFTFHAVGGDDPEDRRVLWAHTHGLQEIGRFDFDFIEPSDDALSNRTDFMRNIAFAILEERLVLDGPAQELLLGAAPLRCVSAAKFLALASGPAVSAYRGMADPRHLQQHGVVCEAESRGFFARLFGRGGVRPARQVSQEFPEGTLSHFSTDATDLMASRARQTLEVFWALTQEFAEFEANPIVKLRCPTSSGNSEYPWFGVHGMHGDKLDATCLNKPIDIPGMEEGQRGEHGVEDVVDWMILLPFAQITPRQIGRSRQIRAKREHLREIMANARAAGAGNA